MKSTEIHGADILAGPDSEHVILRVGSEGARRLLELQDAAYKRRVRGIRIEAAIPARRRSTGPRSENSRLWGHCGDIASQLVDGSGEPVYTTQEIKDAVMRMAAGDPEVRYPTTLSPDGLEVPMPTRRATSEQLRGVFAILQRFADVHGLWLHEYDEATGLAYRSLGGRSLEEMNRHYPEMNVQAGAA